MSLYALTQDYVGIDFVKTETGGVWGGGGGWREGERENTQNRLIQVYRLHTNVTGTLTQMSHLQISFKI